MAAFAGTDRIKQLAATIDVTGSVSGFVDNTPVVAILVPVINDLAHEGKTSPSKLLIPLSFASMLGETLTLIETSTNILASDIAAQLGVESPGLGLHASGCSSSPSSARRRRPRHRRPVADPLRRAVRRAPRAQGDLRIGHPLPPDGPRDARTHPGRREPLAGGRPPIGGRPSPRGGRRGTGPRRGRRAVGVILGRRVAHEFDVPAALRRERPRLPEPRRHRPRPVRGDPDLARRQRGLHRRP